MQKSGFFGRVGEKLRTLSKFALLAAASVSMLAATPAVADEWPSRTIRMVIPFAPGGVSDVMGRFWAQHLSEALKATIVVENRPGAGTTIAAGTVAKAAPDGYTLYFTDVTTHAINATLYRTLPFKSEEDFSYIAMVAATPLAFVVPSTVPATTMKEFIELAKSKPGALDYASSGTGTILHLAGETLKRMAGIDMVHVPYKGSAEAVTAALGGQVSATFSTLPPTLAQIKLGKLRALAVTSLKPNEVLPNVPPMADTLPGFNMVLYSGIMGPAGIPAEIVNRINATVATIMKDPATRKFYEGIGAEPVEMTPQAFATQMKKLIQEMGVAVKESGASVN